LLYAIKTASNPLFREGTNFKCVDLRFLHQTPHGGAKSPKFLTSFFHIPRHGAPPGGVKKAFLNLDTGTSNFWTKHFNLCFETLMRR
jgi:hypothetical protein